MKRFLIITLIISTCLNLCSCGGIDDYSDVEDFFDEDVYEKFFFIDEYLENARNNFIKNGEAQGIDLNGDIQIMVQMVNKTLPADAESEWAYIVQCYDETGATEVETLVSQTQNCKRFGRVVVYGNSPIIDEITE